MIDEEKLFGLIHVLYYEDTLALCLNTHVDIILTLHCKALIEKPDNTVCNRLSFYTYIYYSLQVSIYGV